MIPFHIQKFNSFTLWHSYKCRTKRPSFYHSLIHLNMSSPLLLHRVLFACLLFYYAAVLEARNKQQCDKYLEFEQQLSCGPSGYPIGYGFRYCHRFYDHYDEFTSNGQQYIDCTGKCLIDQLNRYINEVSVLFLESIKEIKFEISSELGSFK